MKSLSEILASNLSDKVSAHSYGPLYEKLFDPIRETATNILEIGVLNGCSLRAWREYFTFANVYGIDNSVACMMRENRIATFHCDTTERDKIIELRDKIPQCDVIIDDASHTINEQVWAVAVFWSKLKPGGIFVVEDILYPQYLELFRCFPNAELHDLRKVRGQYDDMVAVMRKPA